MVKRITVILVFLLLPFLLLTSKAQSKTAAGNLFIIGGGNRSEVLMKQLIETANLRTDDYIVVLPMASAQSEAGFELINRQLSKHTGVKIRNFDFAQRGDNNIRWVDSLGNARLIYILGGDQSRFMKTVINTPIYKAIHKAYQQGGTIAGTSAGAAVMSRYMITGQQKKDTVYRETFDKLWTDNVVFEEGLGLLQDVIIDQHFIKRSRFNRLLSALADKPDLVCIGVDEGTAIIVKGENAIVAGESQVVRLARLEGNGKTPEGLLKFRDVQFGLFTAGDVINLRH
ncbi:MAG TPA: cyanophycinase [Flavisolibacter sp.]|jgi:cyanophycinase|nr:cyanophycinase [Flavisolibacter sp.]